MANIYKRWLCDKSLKTLSSRTILTNFEFRSKPSLLLSFEWTLTRPKNSLQQNIIFSYSEMIPVSFSFFICFFLYFSFLCYVMLCYLFCYYKFLQKLLFHFLFFLLLFIIIIIIIINILI